MVAASARRVSIPYITIRDTVTWITMRMIDMSCSERKFFTMSTSEVQRWIMSPVLFFMCHEKGSDCIFS